MNPKEDKKRVSENIASMLLEIGAVKLQPSNPYKWASGWNSPIYCDNRLSLSFPSVRTVIKNELVKVVSNYFGEAEAIAGVATAGIPQGALIANDLNLPFLYVRPKPKGHGLENLIEGKVEKGQKIIVVEDLISTGGSSLKAVSALKDAGFVILGMVSIFTYGFDEATKNFKDAGVVLHSLSNYDDLVEVGIKSNYIMESDLESLKNWRINPAVWSNPVL